MQGSGDSARETAIMLGVLTAVERDSAITQRSLSSELGIALGLANAYLRRCVRKGLVKVRQAPLNRYAYYLTPGGFAEKTRLTGEYLTLSFKFFRDARRGCSDVFAECQARGLARVALAGSGELAEIAVLSAGECGIEVDCVIDPGTGAVHCAGRPVVASLGDALKRRDGASGFAVVVTDTRRPQDTFDAMVRAARDAGLDADRVIAPALLRVSRGPAAARQGSAGA